MKKSISTMFLTTLAVLLSTSLVSAQTTSAATAATSSTTALKAITTLACYKTSQPLTLFGDYGFATSGWCRDQCAGISQPVMAMSGGSTCYCGGTIPALDQQVASSNCNSPCNGYGTETCGGMNFYQVYLTGMTQNVPTAANTTSSSASGTKSASPSVITQAGATVVVTASSSATAAAQSGGNSKVGVAVGVVVGLLVVAAVMGGFALVLKQRRKRAIEEEHMRNAVIANKRSETTSADSRLDPVIFSHRRESVGSIADEMDYSRRILQVRNPDHRASHQSGVVP